MQSMKQNTLELLVGAIVLGFAIFFFVYAYSNSGSDHSNEVSYKASFDRIDGLVVGADVRMSGVKVGAITKLDIEPNTYMANVTFTVNQTIKLPKDSSAEVISDGLLGGKYLAVVPGGDESYLTAGEAIVHTQSSVNLEAMIGQLIFSNKSGKEDKEN